MSTSDEHMEKYGRELAADTRSTAELIETALAGGESDDDAQAVSVLHYRGTQEVFDAARDLCAHADPVHREIGAWVLGQLGGWERQSFLDESLALLIPMLEDAVPEVAAGAATALSFRHDDRATKPLLAQIAHWDSDVRERVAFALKSSVIE